MPPIEHPLDYDTEGPFSCGICCEPLDEHRAADGYDTCPNCVEKEFTEGRAYVDWNRGGAVLTADNDALLGHAMTDLSDEVLASGV